MRARRHVIVAAGGALLLAAGYGLAACGGDGDGGATDTSTTTTLATAPPLDTTTTLTAPPLDTTTTLATTTTIDEAEPRLVQIVVAGGSPRGGIVRETVDRGDRVVLVVTSDVADEVHLHGYDISRDVAAGGTVRITFTAKLPGRFEVELEKRGVQIADLTVAS